jgi:hypothetical protein
MHMAHEWIYIGEVAASPALILLEYSTILHTLPLLAPPQNWVRLTNFKIDEVTINVLLSTCMSPTAEKNKAIKSWNKIQFRKMRASVSNQLLKSGISHRQVPPWESNQLSHAQFINYHILWIWINYPLLSYLK